MSYQKASLMPAVFQLAKIKTSKTKANRNSNLIRQSLNEALN